MLCKIHRCFIDVSSILQKCQVMIQLLFKYHKTKKFSILVSLIQFGDLKHCRIHTFLATIMYLLLHSSTEKRNRMELLSCGISDTI